jgi:hypothetical protein
VIRAGHRVPPYDETLAFVPRVLGHYRAYQASAEPDATNDDRFVPSLQEGELLRAALAVPAPPPATEPEAPEHGKRPVYIASARRQRRAHPARIFGAGTGSLPRPEPFRSRRGHKSIADTSEVPMATEKRNTPRKSTREPAPQVAPMPFPGESPTVSLALAAGQMYGPKPEDEKPARSRPKRKAASGRKAVAPKKKSAAARRKPEKRRA